MARRRTNHKRSRDLVEAARLALAGEPQEEIARHLEVSQSQISRDLDKVKEQWAQAAREDSAHMRSRELARIKRLEAAGWKAYEQSKEPPETIVTRSDSQSRRREREKTCTHTYPREGNPRYLRQVLRFMRMRERLLRLAPREQDTASHESAFAGEILGELEQLRSRSSGSLLGELDRRLGGIQVWLGLRAPAEATSGGAPIYPSPRTAPETQQEMSETQLTDKMRNLRSRAGLLDWTVFLRRLSERPFSLAGHEYLKGIYLDESPYVVIRKAAQMGASEYAVSRALHFAATRGGRTIYYFPTDRDVREFSMDRLAPALSASPALAALVHDTNTVGLKHIAGGSLYFRGMKSRTRMKSVPADFLIFDELDEMAASKVELARKRLGHSEYGWELHLSTPTLPGYGIDLAFGQTDQHHWLLRCPGCSSWHCLEDEFLEAHGSAQDPRTDIVFVKGEPGREHIVCTRCGHVLDPSVGAWVAKRPREGRRGYALSQFLSVIVSQQDRAQGTYTKPAALLRLWRSTQFPAEFFNSELGLPYLGADAGLAEKDLLGLAGNYPLMAWGQECVMGVDQTDGLHLVVKEPKDQGYAVTVYVHHQPPGDESLSLLDEVMDDFDVRACLISALPNTRAARAFARRFPGRVWLSYYSSQRAKVLWGFDAENTPIANLNRTEALDAWRSSYRQGKRRIPRIEGEVSTYARQMTNVLRRVQEDSRSQSKRAVWIRRGPDYYAHADSYAEIALGRRGAFMARATVLG